MMIISIIKYGVKLATTTATVLEAYKFWLEYQVGERIKNGWKKLKSKFSK